MAKINEGDLYGVIDAFGKTFEIYYGYYEEFERDSVYNDPVPIYPDLISAPVYNDEGYPIVTEMQIACEHYSGKESEDSCGLCPYMQKGEKLFGLCRCPERKNNNQPRVK